MLELKLSATTTSWPSGQQMLRQVRADQPSAARHQHPSGVRGHHSRSFLVAYDISEPPIHFPGNAALAGTAGDDL